MTARRSVLVVSMAQAVWGAELSLLTLGAELARLGVTLRLAAPPGAPLLVRWRAEGLPAAPGDWSVLGRFTPGPAARVDPAAFLRWTGAVALAVRRAARGHDLVQSHSQWLDVPVALGGRLAGTPIVLDLHDRPGGRAGRAALRLAVAAAHGVIAVSADVRDGLPAHGRRKAVVVHRGVAAGPFDAALAGRAPRRDGPLRVAILGRLVPEKGHAHAVRAVQAARAAGTAVELVVAGAGGTPATAGTERLLADAARQGGVRLLGRRDDVPALLADVDVVLNVSDREPFGRTMVEAMLASVPVVAFAAGGALEIVEPGRTGLLVPPGDDAALTAALVTLAGDPALRARLGAAAAARARQAWDPARQAAAVAACYDEVCGAAASSRRGATMSTGG